jgi:hypothetical protein
MDFASRPLPVLLERIGAARATEDVPPARAVFVVDGTGVEHVRVPGLPDLYTRK